MKRLRGLVLSVVARIGLKGALNVGYAKHPNERSKNMTREELTNKVCAAASEIIGKPIGEDRLDIGTRALIAVLADNCDCNEDVAVPLASPGDDSDDDAAERLNSGNDTDGGA